MKAGILFVILAAVLFNSCNNAHQYADASGTFEAIETIISAEATGKILQFEIAEGQLLNSGEQIGMIDSNQIYLSRQQLIQNRKAVLSGRPDINMQIESLKKELVNAQDDKRRIENLVKGDVASQKQLDDATTRVEVIEAKIDALKSSLSTTSTTLTEQGNTIDVQLELLNDQIAKCRIINPVKGTVLVKYAEQNEMTIVGKPLYKIADLSTIVLRVYITGNQIAQVKLNQKVKVLTDDGSGGFKETDGVITWISDKAEFTPKTIQTKDERANLVYATKVSVKNDGYYKIGMYGEIKF